MTILPLLLSLASSGATLSSTPGVAVREAPLQGIPLCVWNDSSLFSKLKTGMQERADRVFRFPNGSYSDIYHWNGTGTYTADSIWLADSANYSSGWTSASLHAGITYSTSISKITDGDTSTFWWSNPEHPNAPGWFYMDLGAAKKVDSLGLWLGSVRPDSVQILHWNRATSVYPYPYQQTGNGWVEMARLPASSFVGYKIPDTLTTYYIAVRPIGTGLANGWQVREFVAYDSGAAVSSNVNSASQTATIAVSTHPSGKRNASFNSNWDFEAFMNWIKAYPNADPMVCVNYGTGTPQEAAAWVHYANKVKGYGIKRWQVGNESSGNWEEAGCVSARQYATRYVAYAKAMKAADPTIEVIGPVLASTDFVSQASGDYDSLSFLQSFLQYVDSVEQKDGVRLLDGVDFHNYTYWFSGNPNAMVMMAHANADGAKYDTLEALIGRTLQNPLTREVLMSEFNTSTVSSSLEMTASAGSAVGLQFTHFIQRFGNRGVTNLWELYEGGGTGDNGTWGSLSAFIQPTQGEWSSLNYPPNASFWSTRMIMRQWLDTAGGDTIVPVEQDTNAISSRIVPFGVRNNGRVSVLLFNIHKDSTSFALDPSLFPNGGDILSWGEGEYLWNGTSSTARAIPNNGPSSRTFTTFDSVKVPGLGMVIVRGAGRSFQAPHTTHWLLNSTNLSNTDSLTISGWTTSEGTKLTGGYWKIGDSTGALVSTDNSWDGPSESWKAVIPHAVFGSGEHTVSYFVYDAKGDTISGSHDFEVMGELRPVLLISDFEDQKAQSTWEAAWSPWSADDSTVSQKIVTREDGYCMKDSLMLTQPSDLGYTTLYNTTLTMPKNMHELDSLYSIVGIVFDWRNTISSAAQYFAVNANLTSIRDYNAYSHSLAKTSDKWVRDTILFSDMSQASWGKSVTFNIDSLASIDFNAHGAGKLEFYLDNVAFLGTQGNAITLGIRNPSAVAVPLTLSGRQISVNVTGAWTLRIVNAAGRTSERLSGNGPSLLSLHSSGTPRWALLESRSGRRALAIPSVLP